LTCHFRHFIDRQIVAVGQLLIAFRARGVDAIDQRQRFCILTIGAI
jgi:hypothetical protein